MMFHRGKTKKNNFFKFLFIFLILYFLGSLVWLFIKSGQLKFYLKEEINEENIKTTNSRKVSEDEQLSNGDFFEEIKNFLTLTVLSTVEGTRLTWVPYQGDDFKFYKIARSEDNPYLKYPEDGSIKYFGERNFSEFIDETAEKGTRYYYRICVKVESGMVKCGNVAEAGDN